MSEVMYLIDGNSYAYRFFYAIPPLTTKDGMEINAVFGFFNLITKILREKQPNYIAVVFDSPVETFRHKIYKEYKIHREKMPESLQNQIGIIQEICKNSGIQIFQYDGYEADDIIANLSIASSKHGIKVMVMSGDKDIIQIVNDNINIYKISKDKETIITPNRIKEEYGIEPCQIIDVLALMGDPSDNIPGVKGIGEKTAINLIKQYKNIDTLLEKVEEIKPEKIKLLIKESVDIIKLSRKLVLLDIQEEIPEKIGFSLEQTHVINLKENIMEKEFLKYNFKSLVANKEKIKQEVAYSSFEGRNIHFLDEIKDEIIKNDTIVIFFMGGERNPELIIIGVNNRAYYIFGKNLKQLPPEYINGKKIITNHSKTLFYYVDAPINKNIFDITLISHILNPGKIYRDISHIFTEFTGDNYLSYEDVVGKGAKKVMVELVDVKFLSTYSGSMVQTAFTIISKIIDKLKKCSLESVYYDIELPLVKVLSCMERTGLKIDRDYLGLLKSKFEKKIGELAKNIYDKAGGEFNLNSPKQLSEILFNRLKLPIMKKIKTGFSTDNEVLLMLYYKHPIIPDIINYRTLTKIKTSFLDVIEDFMDEDCKIFPYYNQSITATGRLSSSEPNIQNIPIRDEEGKEIRKIFIPLHNGDIIVKADYSQIELRILAHFSGDEKLNEYFLSEKDVHTMTAAEIFGINYKDVTETQRRVAKTINFGIIYGMSKFGLSKELKISLQEAGNYITKFFSTYKKVKEYHDNIINLARKKGYVETLLGRKRYIPDINSSNKTIREFAARTAINSPIQGTAADIIKKAMIEIFNWFTEDNLRSKMILQVHDELVFSVPPEEKEIIKLGVSRIMENVVTLKVPLKIKIGIGKNWYECE